MSTANVENLSNGVVTVAMADNQGNLISEGWWNVAPNQKQTITSADSSDMYLRVQFANGNEADFSNFNTFLFFPTTQARFTVNRSPLDPNVRVLRWGGNLENTHDMTANEPLPAGWTASRYFRVGSGVNENFQVLP